MSDAYIALDAAVSKRQRGFAEQFANGLADWSSAGSTSIGVIGVEHVLEEVVAKVVAQKNRVLMIVLDGMSWAVCHELLEDIRQDHWFESTFDEDSAIPHPVIATVPSETTVFSHESDVWRTDRWQSDEQSVVTSKRIRRSSSVQIVASLLCCSTRRTSPREVVALFPKK